MSGFRTTLGGTAVVCCVHDREKRELVDPDFVKFLGRREYGITFDPAKHKLLTCACCENLFVTTDDTPRLCTACNGSPTHKLEAPLPEPIEGAV